MAEKNRNRNTKPLIILAVVMVVIVIGLAAGFILYSEFGPKRGSGSTGSGKNTSRPPKTTRTPDTNGGQSRPHGTTRPPKTTQPPTSRSTGNPRKDNSVLIIGGGMSGITAAWTLHRNGYNFTILEASNRLGGRVKSKRFSGVTVEVGAGWIIGLDGNPIWRLVQDYSIGGITADYDSFAVRASGGWDLTSDAVDEYDNRFNDVISGVEDMGETMRDQSQPDLSIRGSVRQQGWIPKKQVEHAVEYYHYDFLYSAPPEQVSVRYTHSFPENHSEYFIFDDRGFDSAVRSYAYGFLNERDPRLKLNHMVTDIQYDDTGCSVTTDSGDTFKAGFCILTVSLGVLQRDSIQFQPELPAWKTRAIQKHGMSSLTQIHVKFPNSVRPFWDRKQYIVHASDRRGYYPLWVNLEAPGLLKEGSNMLMLVVSGQEAERLEKLSDLDLKKEIAKVLGDMYSQTVPLPVEVLSSRFISDPLFYGAHARWPYGFVGDDMKAFKAALESLYFAGEATSEKHCGYLQGAYESGIDAAQAVIKCIHGDCQQFIPPEETCYT